MRFAWRADSRFARFLLGFSLRLTFRFVQVLATKRLSAWCEIPLWRELAHCGERGGAARASRTVERRQGQGIGSTAGA